MEVRTFSYRGGAWSVALAPALDSPSTLVLAFGGSGFGGEPGPLDELARAYPSSQILGCSTSGEIFGTDLADDSVVAAVVRFTHTRLRRSEIAVDGDIDSAAAGQAIAAELMADDLRGVFLLGDGVHVNGSALVRGLNAVLPESVVVTGGMAGDGPRFERTWTLGTGGPRTRLVSAVGLYGDRVHIGHGSRAGWDLFGPTRVVTRARGNVLFELDGRPALGLYKEYLGDRSSALPAAGLLYPISVRATAESRREVVRTLLAVDEGTQSMTFAADIPENGMARLLRPDLDRVIQGAGDAGLAAATVTAAAAGAPVLAITVSCVGRRLVLGERTGEEIEAVADSLPAGAAQIGFYAYGGIAPHGFGACNLHNQTMTLTTICER